MHRQAMKDPATHRPHRPTAPRRGRGGPDPRTRLIPVTDAAMLEAWLARSGDEPVILFNSDPRCGGNDRAHRVVSDLNHDVVLVDVRRFPRLGAWIAARTGVRHESPQVLVMRGGQVAWHADHGRITAESVATALRTLA